jgi:hypothetical protein
VRLGCEEAGRGGALEFDDRAAAVVEGDAV